MKYKYTEGHNQTTSFDFQRCDYLNISVCRMTETKRSIVINLYNPIARRVNTYMKIPVNSRKLITLDSKGNPVKTQIQPVSKPTAQLRGDFKGFATYELTFRVSIPPLGYSTYFVNRTSDKKLNDHAAFLAEKTRLSTDNNFIENEHLRLEFSSETGRLIRMINKNNKVNVDVDQNFFWYQGSVGDKKSGQASGAYIFRPQINEAKPIRQSGKVKVKIIKGALVDEVHQVFSPFVSQVIRLYKGMRFAEFEHTIGPIPVNDKLGKEIITKFQTNIASDGSFYTDANGREMKKRKRDFRKTWRLETTEPISQNYYPINSRIFINDTTSQLTIMADRSQGGTSLKDGAVEIMLHRRLLKDDSLGVGEALNETGVSGKGLVTRGKHLVFLSTPTESARLHRQQGELMMLQPTIR